MAKGKAAEPVVDKEVVLSTDISQLNSVPAEIVLELVRGESYRPQFATELASGMDVRAVIKDIAVKLIGEDGISPGAFIYTNHTDVRIVNDTLIIPPGARALIPVGIKSSFPAGYEVQIRPRSGLAITKGLGIVNSPGTIDADYRDEWGVIVINHNLSDIKLKDTDRVAQVVIAKTRVLKITIGRVDDTDSRGGGFGSSGA